MEECDDLAADLTDYFLSPRLTVNTLMLPISFVDLTEPTLLICLGSRSGVFLPVIVVAKFFYLTPGVFAAGEILTWIGVVTFLETVGVTV